LLLGEAVIVDASDRVLGRSDLAALNRRVGPTLPIHRADLHDVLLEGCAGLPLCSGTTLESLEQRGEVVEVRLSDGRRCEYGLGR
jgi:2-polyprenyl-6-methoxyphenol hydroxylase-like FAD-dependent oxidoreductase